MSNRRESADASRFVHPLQSVLDAMGHDPALSTERRRIQEYIAKSTVVMSEAEPDREDLKAKKLEQIRRDAREDLARTYLAAHLSDRDTEWLRIATDMLRVLTGRPYDAMTKTQENLVSALIMGTYARMAPECLVEDLASVRAARQAEKDEDADPKP